MVARWTIDHYYLSSNLGVDKNEWCFVFDFASLPLDATRPIWPTVCTNVAVKHQSSITITSNQLEIEGKTIASKLLYGLNYITVERNRISFRLKAIFINDLKYK